MVPDLQIIKFSEVGDGITFLKYPVNLTAMINMPVGDKDMSQAIKINLTAEYSPRFVSRWPGIEQDQIPIQFHGIKVTVANHKGSSNGMLTNHYPDRLDITV